MSEFETRTFGDAVCVQGDCLNVMPKLEKESISFIFCDFPYGITHQKWDQCLILSEFWKAISKARSKACTVAITATQPFATDAIASNRKEFRYDLIWDKQKGTDVFNARCRPMRSHENILIFSQASCNPMSSPRMTYNAQKTNGIPYTIAKGVNATKTYGSHLRREIINLDGKRYPLSIQQFKRCKERIHPTQKPVSMLSWLIATYTNPGDIILDPTAGSGTTGVAALNLGRRAVLIEKDPTYFEVMCKRIAEHQQKMESARE